MAIKKALKSGPPVSRLGAFEKNHAFRRGFLFNTVDRVIEYNEPVTINTKKGNAVIISEEDYNAFLETIYLISQPGLVNKIKEGEKEKISEMDEYNPNEEW